MLRLDEAGWKRFADGLSRAEELARSRSFSPVFHAHTSTSVEALEEIDRMLDLSTTNCSSTPATCSWAAPTTVHALRHWGPRVDYVHLKDALLDVVRNVIEERAGGVEAWRRGICELGAGDVDLDAFLAALRATGYNGSFSAEQDRIPRNDERLGVRRGAGAETRVAPRPRTLTPHACAGT